MAQLGLMQLPSRAVFNKLFTRALPTSLSKKLSLRLTIHRDSEQATDAKNGVIVPHFARVTSRLTRRCILEGKLHRRFSAIDRQQQHWGSTFLLGPVTCILSLRPVPSYTTQRATSLAKEQMS